MNDSRVGLTALAAALTLAGCAGSGERRTTDKPLSAEDRVAAMRVVESVSDWVNTGEFDRYWAVLHPAHQALISPEDFQRCWSGAVLGISTSSKLIWVRRVKIKRSGIAEQDAVAVRYRRDGKWEDGEPYSETLTRDVVTVDGKWRYLLAEEFADDLRNGLCPVDHSIPIKVDG
jgi:hypothetical protein